MISIKEQLLLNTQSFCLDRLRQDPNLAQENIFNDPIIQATLKAYWDNLNRDFKEEYSIENLQEDLFDLIKKVELTQAAAESDELVTWLDTSRRINPEIRFNAYKKLLVTEGKGSIAEQMDADTYKILDSCYDPSEMQHEWDRRGLVYGHVQSGKTANYIGLINRAFDSGYQVVIVLTGMTEDLRRQTQERIDSGVVGQRERVNIGIGNFLEFRNLSEQIKPATSLKKDLKKSDDWRDNNLTTKDKSIWVIKKNKAVLENLIMWLDLQRSGNNDNKINRVPFLVIDDEADNASIQSLSKKDYQEWGEGMELAKLDLEDLTEEQEKKLADAKEKIIKAINRNIRVALSLMSHKTFVAYTATPYSIINQTVEDLEREVVINGKTFNIEQNSDLFPEHFIIPISAGGKYMGIERIFSSDKKKRLPVVIDLTNKYKNEKLDENYFPTKRGEGYIFEKIPESLEDAIIHFLISVIIRKHRKHKDYNSLLVHTSHLTNNADYLAEKIETFISTLKNNLPSNSGNYFSRIESAFNKIKKNSRNPLFNQYFGQDYSLPKNITRTEILDLLYSNKDNNGEYKFAPFELVSYHSSLDSNLKHKNHTLSFDLKDDNGNKKFKNYIVVGGNRLSRGLTLEGLTTSYFIRNSTRQDSLYQMGRWFGYRIGFEDLVRIYMPIDQILWFEGVFKLEMALRKDFEANNHDDTKVLPRNAIIKLAYHTNEDMFLDEKIRKKFPTICDPNKLHNTRTQLMSFYGATSTNKVSNNPNIQEQNLNLIKRIFKSIKNDNTANLFDMTNSFIKNNNVNYINVKYQHILDLLDSFIAHDDIKVDIDSLRHFIKINNNELDKWSFVLVNKTNNPKIKGWKMDFYNGSQEKVYEEISSLKRVNDKSVTDKLYYKSILDQQKDNIFDIIETKEEFDNYNNSNKQAEIAKKYRHEKQKPIMLVYPVLGQNNIIIPILYCFIPKINGAEKVKYIVRNQ